MVIGNVQGRGVGLGIGVGCGFGVGWGVGGSPISAYGIQAGAGCGVGVGLGWGLGLGFGSQVPNTNTEFIGLDNFAHTQTANKGWGRGPLGWVWSRLQTQRYMEQYLGSDPYVGFKNPGQRDAGPSTRPHADGLLNLISAVFGRTASQRYSVEKDKFAGFRKAIMSPGMMRAPAGKGETDASQRKVDDKQDDAKG